MHIMRSYDSISINLDNPDALRNNDGTWNHVRNDGMLGNEYSTVVGDNA